MLINELRTKYGEKVAAQYEMEIGNGQRSFELAKKRGEFSDNAEFNTLEFLKKQGEEISTASSEALTWAIHLADVEDAWTKMWDLMQEDVVETRGSQTVEDATIENMKASDDKIAAVLAKIKNKRLEKKYKDKEESIKAYQDEKHEQILHNDEMMQLEKDLQTAIEDKEYRDAAKKRDRLQKLYELEIENNRKLIQEKIKLIDHQKYLDDTTSEMASKTFDDKWKKMIEFENKYNTDLGLSGEDVNKLTKEQLDERLSEEEQYYEVKNKMQEMSVRAAADFTSMLINDVLLGEKEFRKEMIGDFVKGIGTQMVADGTFHIFSGIAKGWAGNPAGWAESKAGVVEVGVGVGLGATAKAIGTSGGSESKSKETASADRKINNNNNGRDQMQVYLYPSQKYYLRTHNNANKKLGYKK